VTTEQQRAGFLAALAADEDWLYSDEGEDAAAPAFRKRLAALRAVGDPMALRAAELAALPKAVADARAFLALARAAGPPCATYPPTFLLIFCAAGARRELRAARGCWDGPHMKGCGLRHMLLVRRYIAPPTSLFKVVEVSSLRPARAGRRRGARRRPGPRRSPGSTAQRPLRWSRSWARPPLGWTPRRRSRRAWRRPN